MAEHGNGLRAMDRSSPYYGMTWIGGCSYRDITRDALTKLHNADAFLKRHNKMKWGLVYMLVAYKCVDDTIIVIMHKAAI